MRQNIYLDCTNTYTFGGRTGIQRVVRNLARYLSREDGQNMCFRPIFYENNRFYLVERGGLDDVPTSLQRTISILKAIYRPVKIWLPRAFRVWIVRVVYGTFMRLRAWRSISPVEFKPGDALMFIDAFWVLPLSTIIPNVRKKGVRIGLLIYDVIPVTHPELVDDANATSFRRSLDFLLPLADFTISISASARDSLISLIKKEGASVSAKHDYFLLGTDMDTKMNENKILASSYVREIMDARPTFLVVGTIEPRKNHISVIEAFTTLWEKGMDVNVLFVGKIGWKVEDLVGRLKKHPRYNKNLFLIGSVSDSELSMAYQFAEAVIAPAIVEGFDLPLVEALCYKKPVIASDIPVHREIGGRFVTYVSPDKPEDIVTVIEKKEYAVSREGVFLWLRWEDSANMFREKIGTLIKRLNA